MCPGLELVVQSEGGGNDDPSFYRHLGFSGPFRTLTQAVKESGPGVVVSVRLHGSLEALHLGCPTIHLAYERKGYGAATDLGIEAYTHSAFSFDPALVKDQIEGLTCKAEGYWAIVKQKASRTATARDAIVDSIKAAYHAS